MIGGYKMYIKGFIINYNKYLEDEIVGEWIKFPIKDKALQSVFKRIGLSWNDEDEIEDSLYIFYDWKCNFEHDFNAYETIEAMNYYANQLKFWDERKFLAACECWDAKTPLNLGPHMFELYSELHDEESLGKYFANKFVNFHNNETLEKYFDFERYGKDVVLSMNGRFTNYGFIRPLQLK